MKLTEAPAKTELALRNRHRTRRIHGPLMRRIIRAALASPLLAPACGRAPRHVLGVVLVGDAEMIELNRRWLGHEGTTDVIAFEYGRGGRVAESEGALRGDVVISLDTAQRAARRYGTLWQSEVVRYLLHGFLHLRGFDDRTPSARRQMKQAENALLRMVSRRFDLRRLGLPVGGRRLAR